MTSKTIITNALLATNWDHSKKDYLDIISPFVLFAAFHENDNEYGFIDVPKIRQKLNVEFRLNIIDSIIFCILNRYPQYISVKKEKGTKNYFIRKGKYNYEAFLEKRSRNEQEFDYFISKMGEYIKDNCGKEFTKVKLEEKLIKFIEGNYIGLLSIDNDSFSYRDNELASFLEYILEQDRSLLNILQKIVKGHMIYVAIYSQDIKEADISQKFNNLYIYFDTIFIFYLLGYGGEYYKEFANQTYELLKGLGANLRCFTHNYDEVHGILVNCERQLKLGDKGNFDKLEWFIDNGCTPTDVALMISSLENNISKLMDIVATPDYNNPITNIDWVTFTDYLDNRISYRKEKALTNDVESIAAIFRLRKGLNATTIENCNAVFVTTNTRLIKTVHNYKKEHVDDMRGLMPCISDYEIANIAWLKSPAQQGKIVDKSIRFAASILQEPSPEFWNKFIKEIDKYRDSGELKDADVIELKYQLYSRKNAGSYFEEDEERINLTSIQEWLRIIHEEQHKEILKELHEKTTRLEKLKKDEMAIAEQKAKKKGKRAGRCACVAYLLSLAIVLAVAIASIIHLCLDWSSAIWAMVCVPIEIIGIMITLFPTVRQIWHIKQNLKKIGNNVENKERNKLYEQIEKKYAS